jgi:calcineurin-like phosphoesterase family protein
MYWFTSDEHYGHNKIIGYCNRPFRDVEEMNRTMVFRHNQVVNKTDVTIHIGDFGWFKKEADAQEIIHLLNGNHIFIKGSHDRWLKDSHPFMWRRTINNQFIVCCHYAMRTWERAHYGAWNLYGHSHGTLSGLGKQMDVGVDTHNFYPYSFEEIKARMDITPCLHGAKHDVILEKENDQRRIA